MVCSKLREYLPDGFRMIVLAPQASLEFLDIRGMRGLFADAFKASASDGKSSRKMSDALSNAQKKKQQRPRQRTREELEIIEETKKLLMKNNRIFRTGSPRVYSAPQCLNSGVGLIGNGKDDPGFI